MAVFFVVGGWLGVVVVDVEDASGADAVELLEGWTDDDTEVVVVVVAGGWLDVTTEVIVITVVWLVVFGLMLVAPVVPVPHLLNDRTTVSNRTISDGNHHRRVRGG